MIQSVFDSICNFNFEIILEKLKKDFNRIKNLQS